MAFNYYGFFDGASKGNPGKAGCGALLKDSKGTTIWQIAYPIGLKTNNEAEYSAIILLQWKRKKAPCFSGRWIAFGPFLKILIS